MGRTQVCRCSGDHRSRHHVGGGCTLQNVSPASRAHSPTKALTLGAGKRLNIYTDRHYAFATAHVHGAIYQERGLLTAEGQTIKNKQEILDLLTALWLPAKLAIIYCQGHQKADDLVARGNRKADQAAKAVSGPYFSPHHGPTTTGPGRPILPAQPKYSQEELQQIKRLPMAQEIKGW